MEQKLDLGNFGANLKRFIKDYNANHEESFADVIDGYIIGDYCTIYHYFNGSKRPSLETLIYLADKLEVSLEDLLS